MTEKNNGQNSVAASAKESVLDEYFVGCVILIILNERDRDKVYDLVDDWKLKVANVGSDSVLDLGVFIGKLDEDGDFVEYEEFVIKDYADVLGKLLMALQMIVLSIAKDIIEYISENK